MDEATKATTAVEETLEPPNERHRDEELDKLELTDDLNLTPDFEAEETDEADEVFEDDIEEGVNPDEFPSPQSDEETS